MAYIAKKQFGQNFLVNDQIIHKIVRSINLKQDQNILEIGPGKGALTNVLINQHLNNKLNLHLSVVEIDRDLINGLNNINKNLSDQYKFNIFSEDILKFDFDKLENLKNKYIVIGNLPYNISTPLLFKLIKNKEKILDIHVMLQKEVADRITSTPGNKNYGRLSVMLQYHCKSVLLFNIGPENFSPQPKVNSSFVKLTPYETVPFQCNNYTHLEKIVTSAFNQRRKTISNSLKMYLKNDAFVKLNLDPKLRAEQLTVQDFVNIANL